MKKIFCAVTLLVLFVSSGSLSDAEEKRFITLGILSKMNSTEEKFSEAWKKSFAPDNENLEVSVKFYDSLNSMQMALNAGEINHMVLPDAIAEYIMNVNPDYEAALVLRSNGMGLAFGFRENDVELQSMFNTALLHLRNNWTLAAIEGLYIASPGVGDPEPVEFEKFDNAGTIRVAVTGDLPPIDFIAPDGTPAGFNTAVLAEIGKYVRRNIELVNVESGSRTAALASGRADVVFWYEVDTSGSIQSDVPEGVVLSEPYFGWYRFIHLRKAQEKRSSPKKWNLNNDVLNMYLYKSN